MKIKSICQTSYENMYKITPFDFPTFYIRQEYIFPMKIEEIIENAEFDEEKTEILTDGGLCSAVEFKAVEYLARAEQSRFGLTQKLLKKNYQKKYIEKALNFLESKNLLSDERFSKAWLNSRRINHYEGRSKLINELCARGISKDCASFAVENFFLENDETEICKKAYQKRVKQGKTDDKLIASLLTDGFSYKMIKNVQLLSTT